MNEWISGSTCVIYIVESYHTPRSSRTCNQPLSACLVRKYRNTSRSRSGSIVLSVVSFKNEMGSFNNQKDSVVPD
jgi:hypothetical protein